MLFIDKLYETNSLDRNELKELIEANIYTPEDRLFYAARRTRERYYGRSVYFRGLIEFSNYCKNNCYYCGIRRNNKKIHRYRLTKEEILDCCAKGYELGFRTFVLQGGEDPYYTDEMIVDIIESIREKFPDCAITLSIGERPYDSYRRFWDAGADRYLLRHETANEVHYRKLHPSVMTLKSRKECLYNLKEIGFQVGAGFMVGSPYQTIDNLVEDLLFLKELEPHMVGIGPFIPHKDTIFRDEKGGNVDMTLLMLALIRLLLPKALIPSTTALGTVDPLGREKGFAAGANVVMPNLSPQKFRADYSLYDNKICTGLEAAESVEELKQKIEAIGFIPDMSRGDHIGFYLQKKAEFYRY